jgi:hypothetical protein
VYLHAFLRWLTTEISSLPQKPEGFSFFRPSRLGSLSLASLTLMALLMGCGKGSQEHLAEARQFLANSAYSDAIVASDAGLQAEPDEVSAWGLELVKLEAFARGGEGEAVMSQLDHLAQTYPTHLTGAEYSSAAHQLTAAEQGTEAIQVLDMGIQRFPEDGSINKMLEDLKAAAHSDVSPEELEMLRKLGYIE